MANKKSKNKKKMVEMSVEEFMEHGLDSDVSCEEEFEDDKILEKKSIKQKSKSAQSKQSAGKEKSHRKQLDRLKERDPEFYTFLQENDEELLEFSGSENGDNDDGKEVNEGDEDSDDENDNEEIENSDQDDENECVDGENFEGKQVTSDMILNWKKGLEDNSLKTLKQVMSAFHAAVASMAPDDSSEKQQESQKKTKYVAKDGSTFNSLATMCLKHSMRILDKHVVFKKDGKSKNLPSSSKDWSKVKGNVKQYIYDMLQLLRQLADVSMLTIILRHCQALVPYYAVFPKIAKMFLKRTIRMWSSGNEHVKVLAFLCIRKCVYLQPNLYEFVLKKLYLGFVQNAKFMSVQQKPILVFMQNSLVEMFAINEAVAYQHAFVYIRQLAIHLRNAITIKKKDAHQTVYNWQFMCSLQLWAHLVGELYGETLKPLVYPIVQITLGVSRLVPSARYYPIRFHCIQILNYLSRKTGVYIPTASYVLEIFESSDFIRKPKSSEKIPNMNLVLKVTKSQVSAKGYQDAIIDMAFESLLEHYVIFSNSIAFPELIFPFCHRLKRVIKFAKVSKISKDMKALVEKLQKHSDEVNKLRSQVTFTPKDLDQVNKWEEQQKEKTNSLDQFYLVWKRMKELSTEKADPKTDENDTEKQQGDIESSLENHKSGDRKRKQQNTKADDSKKKKKKELQNLTKEKLLSSKKRKSAPRNTGEDIIEDFKFSDDEA